MLRHQLSAVVHLQPNIGACFEVTLKASQFVLLHTVFESQNLSTTTLHYNACYASICSCCSRQMQNACMKICVIMLEISGAPPTGQGNTQNLAPLHLCHCNGTHDTRRSIDSRSLCQTTHHQSCTVTDKPDHCNVGSPDSGTSSLAISCVPACLKAPACSPLLSGECLSRQQAA